MGRGTLFITAILLTSVMFAVPLVSEDSDASGTGRAFIGNMVYHTEIVVPEDTTYHDTRVIVVLEGSERHMAIEEFIADPLGKDLPSVLSDDITGRTGAIAHLYEFTNALSSGIEVDIGGETHRLTMVDLMMERTGFQMKAGDTVTFSLLGATTNSGQTIGCSISPSNGGRSTTVAVGETVEITAPGTMSYVLMPDSYPSGSIYVDFLYDIEGNSVPNGSATLFMAVCFIAAALTILLLVIGALPPRWSE